jgi:hypothetical protein
MLGPDLGIREFAAMRAAEAGDEDELEGILVEIEGAINADMSAGPSADPFDDLAAVESWASVASGACARFYAPASPWPRSVAGWSKRAAARLRSIANTLKAALQPIAQALAAVGFSISVSFPWGIAIGVSW